jgi:3-deoxy-D-manno-octulosonic-acid transferase
MNIFYITYVVITTVAFVVISPFLLLYALLSGRSLKGLSERLGWISRQRTDLPTGSPHIWIHAVSLGEVRVAEAIAGDLKRLIPDSSITISAMTEHGRNLASEIFGKDVRVIYAPFDIIPFVRMALKRISPDALVFLETELWPAWASEARRKCVKIAVINGRISSRSFGRYLRLRPLFKYILSKFDVFSMISEEDKKRITAMGADPAKVFVNGNAKFDLLKGLAEPSVESDMRTLFSLKDQVPVLIAGSTRTGEEEIVIDAYKQIINEFPDTVLFIAPRHIERSKDIAALLEKNRLEFQFRSDIKYPAIKRDRQVVIIDSFGELFRLYSIGTVIFSGASLVPLGGQNPLEAAIWGKPVLYGPSMEDFLDARALLEENNAGIEVSNADMLAEKVIMLLKDKMLLDGYGSRARDSVLKNRKAAERHAAVVANILIGTH